MLMAKVKVFSKVGKIQGQCNKVKKLRYHVKGLETRNTYVHYDNPITSGEKVNAKVKFFCHRVTDRQTDRTKTRCSRIACRGHKNVHVKYESSTMYLLWFKN